MDIYEIMNELAVNGGSTVTFRDEDDIEWDIRLSNRLNRVYIKGEKPIIGRSVSSVEDLCSQLNESQIYYNYGFNADKSAVTIKDTIYIKNLSIDNIQNLICELGVSLNSVAHLASGKDGNASV